MLCKPLLGQCSNAGKDVSEAEATLVLGTLLCALNCIGYCSLLFEPEEVQ